MKKIVTATNKTNNNSLRERKNLKMNIYKSAFLYKTTLKLNHSDTGYILGKNIM